MTVDQHLINQHATNYFSLTGKFPVIVNWTFQNHIELTHLGYQAPET